jgi:hypothetical protein
MAENSWWIPKWLLREFGGDVKAARKVILGWAKIGKEEATYRKRAEEFEEERGKQ